MSDIDKDSSDKDRREYLTEKQNTIVSELQRIEFDHTQYWTHYNCSSRKTTTENVNELNSSNTSIGDDDNVLNIPRNILESCEKISDCFEEYVADLNFVQSITWLKAATKSMKNISIEQFHLVFHKQWNNNGDIDKHVELDNQESACRDSDHTNEISGTEFSPPLSISEIVKELNNKENYIPKSARDINPESTVLTQKINDLPLFSSFESFDKYFHEDTEINITDILRNISGSFNDLPVFTSSESLDRTELGIQRNATFSGDIISESDEESSSVKDIFNEITVSQETNCSIKYDKNDKGSDKCDLPDEGVIQEVSITPPSGMCSSQALVDMLLINNDSNQKDSAYDTYEFATSKYPLPKHTQNMNTISIENIEDTRQDNENLSRKDSKISSTGRAVDAIEERTFDKYQRFSKFSLLDGTGYMNKNEMSSPFSEILIQKPNCQKRKRKRLTHESPICKRNRKTAISSHLLQFTLDTLNADEVALQSVRMILSVFKHETIASQYMRRKCWKNSLEEIAVQEILNFCDVFEAGDKTRECTNEIIHAVTSSLDKIMEKVQLNKATISIHQISIITQFCVSKKVCVEIINYLTEKLQYHEDVINSLDNNMETDVFDVTHRLHIIFYALKLCLEEYRSAVPNKWNEYEDEVIAPVTNLWKKQLGFEGETLTDNARQREQRWLTILSNFTVKATDDFVLFAKKSQKLANFLIHE